MDKDTKVTFKARWHKILMDFDPRTRMAVYGAIAEYFITGKIPEMDEAVRLAFSFIKSEIDEGIHRRQKAALQRAEHRNARNHASQDQDRELPSLPAQAGELDGHVADKVTDDDPAIAPSSNDSILMDDVPTSDGTVSSNDTTSMPTIDDDNSGQSTIDADDTGSTNYKIVTPGPVYPIKTSRHPFRHLRPGQVSRRRSRK